MKNLFLLFYILISSSAFACMNLKANLNLNGKELLIDQKVDHDQTYSFMKDNYIVNIILPSGQAKGVYFVDLKVDLKDGNSLKRVSNGQLIVKNQKEAMMTSTDNQTNETFSYKLTVTGI